MVEKCLNYTIQGLVNLKGQLYQKAVIFYNDGLLLVTSIETNT